MKHLHVCIVLAVTAVCGVRGTAAAGDSKPASEIYVAVIDFETIAADKAKSLFGQQLADSVRMRLRRHKGGGMTIKEVIDKLTTREFTKPLSVKADLAKATALFKDKLAVNVGVYGTVRQSGSTVRAEICCINLIDPKKPSNWTKTFSDSSQRARGVLARKIVEAVLNRKEWRPPEYGDEDEPVKQFGKPINDNGGFERPQGKRFGWDPPDNAGTFIQDGPKNRGKVLRIQTDLERDKWYEYRRKLRLGLASPDNPPKLRRDTSYGSVAGLEGIHYRGAWIDAKPGQRYWLVADMKGKTAGIFFPKIFVKGFLDYSQHADALSERSLVDLKMTPRGFAALPAAERKRIIRKDPPCDPLLRATFSGFFIPISGA